MANTVCEVLLTDSPLIVPAALPIAETGAIVDFWGVVRAIEDAVEIAGLRYEAHREMAEYQLHAIAAECLQQISLKQLLVHHRLGFVAVGEASLLVRVGSEHRAAAFRASTWLVDELKKRVPIWKHPVVSQAHSAPAVPA
ncbi:MAG: molybdenum cofactor biosynthesis protein MoaE [Chthoniobacterales bacterium]|nr:molybdenum cofactor biosynthesis protein MoaE [Chthoniobacterales bacterium]